MADEARRPTRLRLAWPVTLLTSLVATLVFFFAARIAEREARDTARESARHGAEHLAKTLDEHREGTRAQLRLASRGFSDAGAAGIYRTADRQPGTLIREAYTGRVPLPATLPAPTGDLGSDLLELDDAAVALSPLGHDGSWVAVARSRLGATAVARWRTAAWLLGLTVVVLCAAAVAKWRERRIAAQLTALLGAMNRLTNGHPGQRLSTDPHDAFGLLAQRFNNMARAVEDQRREITEQAKTLERRVSERTAELQRANHTLRTLDQAKDAFLGNISHELRTPLTAILASTEILRGLDAAEPGPLREFVDIIEAESTRLLDLVGSALSVAEAETSTPVLDPEPCDLAELAEQVVRRCHERSQDAAITVIRRFDGEDFVVTCDREQVAAALESLIDNAIKFSPRGGSVEVSVTEYHSDCQIEVRDEGPGVEPTIRHQIFECFAQAGEAMTDKPRGFGLGLPLSRRIAQAHGGTVQYRSEPGWGACFVLRLPKQPAPSPVESTASAVTLRV